VLCHRVDTRQEWVHACITPFARGVASSYSSSLCTAFSAGSCSPTLTTLHTGS
jgi:hypothetical protein